MSKGHTQKEGEDSFDTYSPVARLANIQLLLMFVALHALHAHQMDVMVAFLNKELGEETDIP